MGLFSKFFKNSPKNDYVLALDIGTEFVKALIFLVEKNLKEDREKTRGLVVGAGRQKQALYHMQAGAVADIEGVTLACRAAIEQAVQIAGLRPKEAIVGLSGELVKGFTSNFVYKRAKPEKRIDLLELKNIIQKIQWKSFEKARRQLSFEMGRPEIEIKLINAAVTDVLIDGHRVTNPLDFQGREVFLSIFNTYAPLVHWGALKSIASKLDLDLINIVSQSYALARAVRLKPQTGNVIIDIGGGTTDIALVGQTGLKGTKSLSLAGRAFTKRLSQRLGVDLIQAEEIKIQYADRKLSQTVCRRIKEIFKNDIRIWLNGLDLTLEEFLQKDILPNQILICGGGSLLPGLKNKLESLALFKKGLIKSKINFIRSKDIINVIDQTNRLKEIEDVPPLALANLALESAEEKGILPSILRQAVRIMQR